MIFYCSIRKRRNNICVGNFICNLQKIVYVNVQRIADFHKQVPFKLKNLCRSLIKLHFKLLKLFGGVTVAIYKSTAHYKMRRNRRKLTLAYFNKVTGIAGVFNFKICNSSFFTFFLLVLGKNLIKVIVYAPPVVKFFRPAAFYNATIGKRGCRVIKDCILYYFYDFERIIGRNKRKVIVIKVIFDFYPLFKTLT